MDAEIKEITKNYLEDVWILAFSERIDGKFRKDKEGEWRRYEHYFRSRSLSPAHNLRGRFQEWLYGLAYAWRDIQCGFSLLMVEKVQRAGFCRVREYTQT